MPLVRNDSSIKAQETAKKNQLFLKAFIHVDSEIEKDEALEILWWLKQAVGMVLGVIFGIVAVRGWIGFALYGILQYAIAFAWASKRGVLRTCLSITELLTESALMGVGAFFLSWTITFTCFSAQ